MKVLIVGSTSVVGKALKDCLTLQGLEVKLAGRREADIKFDLAIWDEQPNLDESFDVVVHVAADFGGNSNEDFIRAELVNSVGTLSSCSLAQHVQAKHFVLLSTMFSTYRAGDPYYGVYSLSKRHSEEAAIFFCEERNLPLTILKPSQIYDDEGLCRRHQAFFYLVADRAQAGQDIELFGNNDARRNYINLSDFSEILLRVVQKRKTGEFLCLHPDYVRISEMAIAAYAAFGTRGMVRHVRDRPSLADLPEIFDDTLYRGIDFRPRIDIREGYKRIKIFREKNS